MNWDNYFLCLAQAVSTKSKDPSTKVGAVIVDKNNRVVSIGFNGLPKGVEDTQERLNNRELKYKLIIHGEINAILFAKQDLEGCTLYTWPYSCCSACALLVIQCGIKRVVAPKMPDSLKGRWEENMKEAENLFIEAGVDFILV